MTRLKSALRAIVTPGVEHRLRLERMKIPVGFWERSYAQEGEDMVLRRLFEGARNGFYVDVGAHHPRRFSNTFYFYRHGWRGINIEPNPDVSRSFARQRERDINLTVAIGEKAELLTYFRFNDPALNTFDSNLARSRESREYYVVDQLSVPVRRLEDVLQEHLPARSSITFLSVDVEGLDLEVLRSNDWSRFRPGCVLVEALSESLTGIQSAPVHRFMLACGYTLFAKTVHTLFYLDSAEAREGSF